MFCSLICRRFAIELLSFGIEVKAPRGYGLGVRGEELGVKRQGSSVRIYTSCFRLLG